MDYHFQVKVSAPDGVAPDDLSVNVLAALREFSERFETLHGDTIEVLGLSVLYVGSDTPNAPGQYEAPLPGPDGLPQNEDASCSVCDHARTEHGALKGAHGEDGCRHAGCNCNLTHGF